MIPYKLRFHGYNALRWVYKNGSVKRSQYFTIKYTENPRRSSPRLAVVVSKKIYKKAVGRNRIRRRLYELLRQYQTSLPANIDIAVIVTQKEVLTLPALDLEKELTQLLSQAGLYKINP